MYRSTGISFGLWVSQLLSQRTSYMHEPPWTNFLKVVICMVQSRTRCSASDSDAGAGYDDYIQNRGVQSWKYVIR
jgi:hypothetical protein